MPTPSSHLINQTKVRNEIKAQEFFALCYDEESAVAFESLSGIPSTALVSDAYGEPPVWESSHVKFFKTAKVLLVSHKNADGIAWLQQTTSFLTPHVSALKVLRIPDPCIGIVDWQRNGGGNRQLLASLPIDRLELPAPAAATAAPKQKKPSRDDYLAVIRQFFGDLRKDIFLEDLVYLDSRSNRWVPALNSIGALRSEVRELAHTTDKAYKAAEIEDHLLYLERSMEPEFVVTVPEWDGRDRLLELSRRIVLSDKQVAMGVDESVFCDLLKNWHCKMWQRLEDPTIRNEIFILAGEQNIGKDFWVRENCDALGQFFVNFSIHSNERDTKEQLHHGLVMNISEFDRTSRAESSLLKEMVTTPRTHQRSAYARRAQTRDCRCSFIASTNVRDIFNDPTGHSRYVFFELKLIDKSVRFSDSDKLQVLAQGQALARARYVPSARSLDAMRDQIQDLTPDDEYDLMVDRWDYLATEKFKGLRELDRQQYGGVIDEAKQFSGFLPNDVTFEIINSLAKDFNKSAKKVRSTLKLHGRQRVHSVLKRGFYFKLWIGSESGQSDVF